MQTILPRLFAVFDDEPVWRDNFSENRFCLLRKVSGFSDPLVVEPLAAPPDSFLTIERNHLEPHPIPIRIADLDSYWWHTGFSICFHTERAPAPVIDFLHRGLLHYDFTLTAQNDETSWCMLRQIDQRRQRMRVEDTVMERRVLLQSQKPQKQPQPATTETPKHVLQAFMRDAQAQGDTCPITCNTPKDCGKVAVTNCFHWFDAIALKTWQQTKNTCPVCKGAIVSTTELSV